MDLRQERLVKNEAVFREVNERIERAAGHEALRGHRDLGFLCECSNIDCDLVLQLTLEEYERVRQDPTQFVVALGHELPEIEEVVFVGETHQVVRKRGAAAEVAKQRATRTSDRRQVKGSA